MHLFTVFLIQYYQIPLPTRAFEFDVTPYNDKFAVANTIPYTVEFSSTLVCKFIRQGYSTVIRIGPIGKVHYLQRSRKKFIAGLVPAKKNKLYQSVA